MLNNKMLKKKKWELWLRKKKTHFDILENTRKGNTVMKIILKEREKVGRKKRKRTRKRRIQTRQDEDHSEQKIL